jgi:hypothetical protein
MMDSSDRNSDRACCSRCRRRCRSRVRGAPLYGDHGARVGDDALVHGAERAVADDAGHVEAPRRGAQLLS